MSKALIATYRQKRAPYVKLLADLRKQKRQSSRISLTLGPLHRKLKLSGQTSGAVIAPAISQGPTFVIESLNYEDDRRSRP
jgi:hypothetical protein